MALLEWQDSFSVGIKEMDDQHKQLVKMINQLHEAMKEGKGSTEVVKIVGEMIEYTQFHFKSEEQLMSEHHFSGLATQKMEHGSFIKKTLEFQADLNSGKRTISIELLNFLKDWLTNHIQVSDKKYSGMMTKN